MENVSIIGIDISKSSFQVHGATSSGEPVLRKKLSRGKVLEFLASQPPCLVVMETCGGAHHWGREIQQLGHEVRLIAPIYVKAFAKRQKSDARDAAAIVEAAQRPTMRFVAVKTVQVPGALDGVPHAGAPDSTAARRRSTRCGVTWRSSVWSRRVAWPMSSNCGRRSPSAPKRSPSWL